MSSSQNIEEVSDNYDDPNPNMKGDYTLCADEFQYNHEMKQEQLQKKSTKATNWSLKSVADYVTLKTVIESLMENSHFIAIKGWIERKTESTPILHSMIKYEKPVLQSSILKQIKMCSLISDDNTSICAVTQSDNVRKLIEAMTTEKTDFFEKGPFKYSRCSTTSKQDAKILIEEQGLSKAKRIWAKEKKSHTVFEQAEAQYKWEETVKIEEELEEEAKKRLQHLFPWQEYVHNIFLSTPDDRTIYVILDIKGGNGKTYIQNIFKDLYSDKVVDVRDGKTADMTKLAEHGGQFKMLQINLSRHKKKEMNLSAVEEIKDGNFASMKYSSKTIRIKTPHVFIYTNMELKWNEMTADRWRIIHLDQEYEEGFKTFTLIEWIESQKKIS